MTMPMNLFIDTPEMQDSSMHQLSNDTETWSEEIIQKMKERIPESSSMNMMIKFMKKDDENGVATGSVIVNSKDKAAIIPIVIKDFMLYPLDVMIAEGKIVPLTPEYFQGVFSSNEAFEKIEEYPTYGGLGQFDNANLWNTIYPPNVGRYAYASAEKTGSDDGSADSGGYPIMDSIADTIDGELFKKALAEDPKMHAIYHKNGHSEFIQKVAHLKPVNMNEFRQGVESQIPRSVIMLRSGSPNKYNILSNSDKVFHPGISPDLPREHCHKLISKLSAKPQDEINDVDQNGEKMLKLPEADDDVFLTTEAYENPTYADEYGNYAVRTKSGVSVEGVVIPHVIDFEQKRVGLKMFIGKTLSTVQPEIAGVRIDNSSFKIKGSVPKVGQTGTFVYKRKGKAVATVPVTITSISGNDCCMCLKVSDLNGVPLKLSISPTSDHALRIIPKGERDYLLPLSMKWVAMEDFGEITNSQEDFIMKSAQDKLTVDPVKLVSTGYGQFSVKGLDKYASACGWDPTMLEGYQVKFLMTSLGAPQTKIAKAMKQASALGSSEIHNLKKTALSEEKVASARPLAKELCETTEKFFKADLTKIAGYMENSQTVDAMLSLNFVNPENISKYVSKIPQFKGAISSLCGAILASRLGLKEIPEQSAAGAMARLLEVVDGLERLKSSQEAGLQEGQQTA